MMFQYRCPRLLVQVIVLMTVTVVSTDALLTNPLDIRNNNHHPKQAAAKELIRDRAYVTRDIKCPDPIPEEGQLLALELMQTGRLYRYNVDKGEESMVSRCETELAKYTGFQYCVGLNSCGSALFLLLKTTGVQPGDKVISNAFTFGAVPSALEHAGAQPVYVETNEDLVMDVHDLELKFQQHPDCHHVMISHMRGKVADMQRIKQLCDQYNAILLEDCAHSLGVQYQNQHSGHVGVACGISSQSYKMINSGEGGFLLTNDPLIAAKAAVYAGAYENLHMKHGQNVPDATVFGDLPRQLPNYSLRMSNLAAAVILPQIATLDERIAQYRLRYQRVCKALVARCGQYLTIPKTTPEVTVMVHDSLQFTLNEHVFTTPELIQQFLQECGNHGLLVELFGHPTNARNYVNWKFAPATNPLPMTTKILSRTCDVRLPLQWDDEDFDDLINVLCESMQVVLGNDLDSELDHDRAGAGVGMMSSYLYHI